MPQNPASATLLIVEDHPLFFSGFAHMARVLRPEWTLHMAATATEARNWLHRHTPNLALVDVGLPGEDGFALLRSLADFWPDLPAVLISGRDDGAIHVRARACGASGFIAKTAPPELIVVMLDRVLQGGRAFVEIAPESGMPSLTPRQAEVLARWRKAARTRRCAIASALRSAPCART